MEISDKKKKNDIRPVLKGRLEMRLDEEAELKILDLIGDSGRGQDRGGQKVHHGPATQVSPD